MPKEGLLDPRPRGGRDSRERTVALAGGRTVGYDRLVVCPGIQLDWDAVPGMAQAVTAPHTSSSYAYELAPRPGT
ncbi:hypothetical protein [Streptomyces sp. KL116D]|uniref:hypothetical protein n=1 Tax=Streptomyces sp. KL116D TaxID=3045152 RepID=UPI0035584667